MSAATHAKVRMASSARYVRELLDELFAPEWVPIEYGGTLTALVTETFRRAR